MFAAIYTPVRTFVCVIRGKLAIRHVFNTPCLIGEVQKCGD